MLGEFGGFGGCGAFGDHVRWGGFVCFSCRGCGCFVCFSWGGCGGFRGCGCGGSGGGTTLKENYLNIACKTRWRRTDRHNNRQTLSHIELLLQLKT